MPFSSGLRHSTIRKTREHLHELLLYKKCGVISFSPVSHCTTKVFSIHLKWNYRPRFKNQYQKKTPKHMQKQSTLTKNSNKLKRNKQNPRRNGKCTLTDVLGELSPLNVTRWWCRQIFVMNIFWEWLFVLIPCLTRAPFPPGQSRNAMLSSLGSIRELWVYEFQAHYFPGGKKVETWNKISYPWEVIEVLLSVVNEQRRQEPKNEGGYTSAVKSCIKVTENLRLK